MQFTHEKIDKYDILGCKSDHGIEVDVWFDQGDVSSVYVDSTEYETYDDTLHGLFVVFKGSLTSIKHVIGLAEDAYDKVVAESNEE